MEDPFLNIMSLITLKKLGKRKEELIPINMKMANFTGGATPTLGILVVEITVGPKTMYSTFFIVFRV
ncbi:hypothetical protein JHK82_050493 [Glycine max]|uniref:Uncharacterized protein n=2 Tax=Glycine subgen. Soja TaxID=1462606 RepID=A0A0R0F0C0_SOYBN|nr:hypothetical protein JHK86_050343 [Glycine max]KAG4924648.1 hypothetical protein JHK87_050188 [Glycine soja]KAG4936217.1 hypothetical protein JHK85_051136 [Glycine max]KAG5091715.1 hypothetical protein JHK82_050493 [Glycine max]KAG5094815.1 hypothetical protein JHK84_050403 [Glycine max]